MGYANTALLFRGVTTPRRRLRAEAGFTLVEMLLTASLLVILLLAVAAISDQSQSVSTRDRARMTSLAAAQAGLSRMTYELRQACYIVPPGATPNAASYCGRASVRPAPTQCVDPALCADFIRFTRTCIQRTTTATCPGVATTCASPPCVTRGTERIRYDCSLVDPANTGTTTCVRFQGGACATAAAGVNPSTDCAAPGRAITACTSGLTSSDAALIRSVLNYGAGSGLDCTSTTRPIFRYCLAADTYTATSSDRISCTGTPATAVAMNVSIYVARRGERKAGLANGMSLQEGVALRDVTLDTTP
jgi:type II secretory pathway pseudopilin PulG